jgi:hypothetical protein
VGFHSITDRLWNAEVNFDGKPVYPALSETPNTHECARRIMFSRRLAERRPIRLRDIESFVGAALSIAAPLFWSTPLTGSPNTAEQPPARLA